MMKTCKIIFIAALSVSVLSACPKAEDKAENKPVNKADQVQEHHELKAHPEVKEADKPIVLKNAVVSSGMVSMRESDDPKSKWMATLMRGEKVKVLEETEKVLKVQLSDDSKGWVSKRSVLIGDDVHEVVVTAEKPLYARPDAASLRKSMIETGTLLFVVEERDGWLNVQLPKTTRGWLKKDDASEDANELAAARSIFRYELLKDSKKEARRKQAGDILAEAMKKYAETAVMKAAGYSEDTLQQADEKAADTPAGVDAKNGAKAEDKKEAPAEVKAENKQEAKPAAEPVAQ